MDAPSFARLQMAAIKEPATPARLSIDAEALGVLADDIAVHGLLQPIGVAGPDADGRYEIGFGHRRYLAHRLLNSTTIDARVWPEGTPLDDIRSSENYNREQLTPMEEAHDVARRIARGESRAGIARALRRSPAWVDARERLIHLPDDLQEKIHTGELAIGVALALAEIDHDAYRRSLTDEAIGHGASITTARVWVAHYHADKPRILSNELAVEQIAQARANYVPYCQCESCAGEVPFNTTRSFRFCSPCSAEIQRAIDEQPSAR